MKVSIIIVNYNGKHLLQECLDSVLRQSYKDFEIILVDNGSSDGSMEFIKENYPSEKIKTVALKENLGFAGGNNTGYRHATGEYIVLLNNDTKVSEDWLRELLNVIEPDENVGIVQSLVLTEGIPAEYYKKNGTINLLGHNVINIFEIDKNGLGEIFQANGCSMIIRWSLVEKLGGLFPDEYFAYAEDTYLCFKVKFSGKKIMHTSKSVVYHKGNVTAKKQSPSFLFFHQERNRLLNFLLFFPGGFIIKYILYLMFNFWVKFFISFFSKKYSTAGLLKAYIWLLTNPKWIKSHRRLLHGYMTTPEEKVLSYISGKMLNGNNILSKAANGISILYCRLAGINIFELRK